MPTKRGNNILLMHYTRYKTQAQANAELAQWACNENSTLGMDGSGSSQIRTRVNYVSYGVSGNNNSADRRTIPQVIGIYNDAN